MPKPFEFDSLEASARVDPLMKKLREVKARAYWEVNHVEPETNFAIRLAFWITPSMSQYVTTMKPDGSWDVFKQLDGSNEIQKCLDKIV